MSNRIKFTDIGRKAGKKEKLTPGHEHQAQRPKRRNSNKSKNTITRQATRMREFDSIDKPEPMA